MGDREKSVITRNRGWRLSTTVDKRAINESGIHSSDEDGIFFIVEADEERRALIIARERACKYLANGNMRPPGGRFILDTPNPQRSICFVEPEPIYARIGEAAQRSNGE